MNDLKVIEQEAVSLKESAKKIVVTDQQGYDVAASFIKGSKDLRSTIKKFFEPTIESFKKAKAEAEKGRKTEVERMNKFLGPVEEAERIVIQKCANYEYEQFRKAEEKRKAAEEIERRKAKAKQDRLLAEAAEKEKQGDSESANQILEEAEEIKPEYVPQKKPEFQRTSGLGIVRRWKWKITSRDLIPKEFWTLNETMINRIVVSKKENTNIPGVEAFRE